MPQVPKRVVSNETIGRRLKTLREERGLTQVELAKKLGMRQSNISAIETGVRGATLHQIIRFARALEVSTDRILLDDKAPARGTRISRRLMRRIERVGELPYRDQALVFQLLEGLLAQRESKKRKVPA